MILSILFHSRTTGYFYHIHCIDKRYNLMDFCSFPTVYTASIKHENIKFTKNIHDEFHCFCIKKKSSNKSERKKK